MSLISTATPDEINSFYKKIESQIRGDYQALEEAAQQFTDLFYESFKESLVLARVFATVQFSELPPKNQQFVKDLAENKGIPDLIKGNTLALSLIGSHGREAAWNDRRNSQGHVGIPLASGDFIELIPMMSRLLKSLGVSLEWIASTDIKIVAKNLGKMAGVFYVPDAKATVDEKGRKIIAAQDFVDKYNIKTVFGFGGSYLVNTVSVVFINFTSEVIPQNKVEQFMRVVNLFKSATVDVVSRGKVFRD